MKPMISKVLNILILTVCVVSALVALLWFVHTFDVFTLPSFIDDFFDRDSSYENTTAAFEEELLSILSKQSNFDGEYEYVTLSVDNAVSLLNSIDATADFFWSVRTDVKISDFVRTQSHSIYKSENKIRIDTPENGADYTTIISNGSVVRLNNETGEKTSYSHSDDFSYSDIINIVDLKSLLASDLLKIESIAIVTIGSDKYLFIKTPINEMGAVNEYFLSLEHGLVLYAASRIGDEEYFKQETLVFDSDSVISQEAFDITVSSTVKSPISQ